ncbi:MAG: molybdopterin molybdotransferase MoeA [Methylobacterium mesophilicum]|nr:molybdopterin molybdotransferase MoeA [Methylobacterium mesophilicum]
MALLPVAEAMRRISDGAGPRDEETVPLAQARGRVLSRPLHARRTQPPFDASAMDGYAVRASDIARTPATLALVGEAAAGRRYPGRVEPGEAVRIFTGAPVPDGADTIAIQENVRGLEDGRIEVAETAVAGKHIRRAGLDFGVGDELLAQGRVLDAAALSLAASGNHPAVPVYRRPLVAVLATGDELVPPGTAPGPDQIVASNTFGIVAILQDAGAEVIDLGILPDDRAVIAGKIGEALGRGADLVVTVGGASVGDHDLVNDALGDAGLSLDFWKIAMRPGKPLMFGRVGETRCIGLPGNPVASLICSHVFVAPLVARLGGRTHEPLILQARLAADIGANDQRQDYVRAGLRRDGETLLVTPFATQDSSMLKFFVDADCLLIRAPHAPAAKAGDPCEILVIRR